MGHEKHEINSFILQSVEEHPRDVSRLTAERFGLNRRSVVDHLHQLVSEGLIVSEGRTKARIYKLRTLAEASWAIPITHGTEEHAVWISTLSARLQNLPDNIRSICQHGFTEMLNNVIDHSESGSAGIEFKKDAAALHMKIIDEGVGIFEKIRKALALSDPREALIELSKGKLTTAPDRHSGEGIFFTSRMFDKFAIVSGELVYMSNATKEDDWLFEFANEPPITGTHVRMSISAFSKRTTQEVFDRFSGADAGFTKTHVPVALARYTEDKLVSRSQARRVLSRFEKFQEVSLDFNGVSTIGQPFADEIFRVFARQNPGVRIRFTHASKQIRQMIARVKGSGRGQGPLL